MAQPPRLGVYGGSFDPIHLGHLAIAEEVRATLALSTVSFVPAVWQPLKGRARSDADHRLTMARLACADNSAFLVDDLELLRPPPSYTVDTIAALRERHGPEAELWFILGSDAARDLPRWHRVEEVIAIARIAIVGRPGYDLSLPTLEAALPGLVGRSILIDGPRLDISSTELRRRIASRRPVRYQVPEEVRRYIGEHGLYQDDE